MFTRIAGAIGVFLSACGGTELPIYDSTTSAIQAGAADSTHTFAVGIVQVSNIQNGSVAFCSGALLAPNLVATARHCIAPPASADITCSSSTFGQMVPANEVLVTTDPQINSRGNFVRATNIVAPSASSDGMICGNDLALIILDGPIQLGEYVTPAISPQLTDRNAYASSFAAIGYGVTTPTDQAGTTAGIRRIKENVPIVCIPNDKSIADCFGDPTNHKVLTATEFVAGDASTCEGDSGSNAFDQASFNSGKWVSFGVLSRGGVSQDGKTCTNPIYARFDSWSQLVIDAAKEAAQAGGYTAPSWTNATPAPAGMLESASSGGCGCNAVERSPPPARDASLLALMSVLAIFVLRRSPKERVHRR
jgi:V8-like Glu-specific endopeptidase